MQKITPQPPANKKQQTSLRKNKLEVTQVKGTSRAKAAEHWIYKSMRAIASVPRLIIHSSDVTLVWSRMVYGSISAVSNYLFLPYIKAALGQLALSLGRCCIYFGHHKDAFNCFDIAIHFGYSGGWHEKGYCYHEGIGVHKDFKKAMKCMKEALKSDKKNANAWFLLGRCYSFGNGVDQNIEEAFNCYENAAFYGSVKAMNALAGLYYNGYYVKTNKRKAIELLERAIELGSIKAMHNLGFCYMTGSGVPINYKKAFGLIEKAAYANNLGARFNLLTCYCEGKGVPRNLQRAWYELIFKEKSLINPKTGLHKASTMRLAFLKTLFFLDREDPKAIKNKEQTINYWAQKLGYEASFDKDKKEYAEENSKLNVMLALKDLMDYGFLLNDTQKGNPKLLFIFLMVLCDKSIIEESSLKNSSESARDNLMKAKQFVHAKLEPGFVAKILKENF